MRPIISDIYSFRHKPSKARNLTPLLVLINPLNRKKISGKIIGNLMVRKKTYKLITSLDVKFLHTEVQIDKGLNFAKNHLTQPWINLFLPLPKLIKNKNCLYQSMQFRI